jgi:hypothetical protein
MRQWHKDEDIVGSSGNLNSIFTLAVLFFMVYVFFLNQKSNVIRPVIAGGLCGFLAFMSAQRSFHIDYIYVSGLWAITCYSFYVAWRNFKISKETDPIKEDQ